MNLMILNDMTDKNSGSIGTAILFTIMMFIVYWILVRNALYRLGVVIQEILVSILSNNRKKITFDFS